MPSLPTLPDAMRFPAAGGASMPRAASWMPPIGAMGPLDGPSPDVAVDAEAPQEVNDTSSLTGCCKIGDPAKRASALVSLCLQWETAVRHLWPAWHECGGMTYGDQFGSFNAQLGLWTERTPVPEKKLTRIELNHMEPICSDVATLQVQDLPNMRATAPTDSAAAASAAISADQLVWWMWEKDGYDEKNIQLREAAAVYGNCFLFPAWDASGGRLVEQVVDYTMEEGPPDPVTGIPSGMAMKEVKEKRREGCFEDRLVSTFAGIYDPCAKDEWDGEGFVIHEQFSLATAKRMYPKHAAAMVAVSSPGGNEGAYYENRMHNASPRTGGLNAKDNHAERKVDQWTIFVRTSDDFYRGRWIVVCSGKIVYEEDNPVYPSDEEEAKGEEFPPYHWPVWRFSHKLIAGSSYGQGVAIRLIGAQKKLNGTASKKLHMLKRTSHPTLVKPSRANFVKTDEVDQQINVPTDLQPGSIYYLQSPGIPQELQMEERLSVEQMERIAGLHAGSRGSSETGDSGTKTRMLFQRDLGRLAATKYRHDKSLGQAFSYKLRVWRRYATSARTIRIVGENNAVSVRSMDMASIAAGTDIIVYQDNGLPRDPGARMLHVEKAVQLGIVDPKDPNQRSALAEAVGLAGAFRKWESGLYADRRCAQDENIRMYEGEQPVVEFWQDDQAHLAAHFEEMNSEAWRRATTPAPEDDPLTAMRKQRTRQLFIGHVQATQNALAVKSGAMPPGPGQGPMGAPPGPLGVQAPPMPGNAGPGMLPPPPSAPAGPPPQKVAA